MKKVSIVVPMYCEQEVANQCYIRIKNIVCSLEKYEHEIIFIDDGSKDRTLEILENIASKDKDVKVISFSKNFGQQSAIIAGLKETTGDAIVIIDADLQDPPEIIPQMLELWEEGNEVIYAKRKKREGESIFKILTAKIFYNTLNNLSDVDIPKDTGDFRLVDRKVVNDVILLPEHNKFLRGLFSWVGYKQTPIEYERKERVAGKTKYTLKNMIELGADGIIGFSTKPLKIIGKIGVTSILISLIVLIYTLLSFVFKWSNLTLGWILTIITITFFAGVELVSIWIVSEYIARIYDEAKRRPEYIINKKINIKT